MVKLVESVEDFNTLKKGNKPVRPSVAARDQERRNTQQIWREALSIEPFFHRNSFFWD